MRISFTSVAAGGNGGARRGVLKIAGSVLTGTTGCMHRGTQRGETVLQPGAADTCRSPTVHNSCLSGVLRMATRGTPAAAVSLIPPQVLLLRNLEGGEDAASHVSCPGEDTCRPMNALPRKDATWRAEGRAQFRRMQPTCPGGSRRLEGDTWMSELFPQDCLSVAAEWRGPPDVDPIQ
ncbi:hypothetical protein ACLOJK_022508 [Asimina triloba]